MTLYDPGPPRPTSRPVEPPVRIRMDGEHVIIRTAGRLDYDTTVALTEAIDVAIATGSVAVLDLDDDPACPAIGVPSRPDTCARWPAPRPYAVAAGFGLLEVPTASRPWTIDVAARRLCHSHRVTDRLFLPASAWIGVRSISISSTAVVAVTAAGDHLATYRQRDASPMTGNR